MCTQVGLEDKFAYTSEVLHMTLATWHPQIKTENSVYEGYLIDVECKRISKLIESIPELDTTFQASYFKNEYMRGLESMMRECKFIASLVLSMGTFICKSIYNMRRWLK